MRRADAVATIGGLVGLTALALGAPWPLALGLLGVALALNGWAFAGMAAFGIALDAAILGVALGAPWEGALAGARLGAALGVNVAILSRVGAARVIDGLRLPPRATALLAAVALAAHDVRDDSARMKLALELDGDWPRARLARVRAGALLVPALLVRAHQRAQVRRDALQLAGIPTRAWFVPVVAIAALAAAGRMAFVALPNVALTYVIAFLGGIIFGPWVAAAGAALAMLMTDFLLTGLYPGSLVNAPAMALLGLAGGAFRRVDFAGAAGRALAASCGIAATLAFSVAADSLTWALVLRGAPGAWAPIVLAGLAFNALPALANGALFALTVAPTRRAFDALRAGAPAAQAPTEAASSPLASTESVAAP